MLQAPNLTRLNWLTHGFGLRDSHYPEEITTVRQVHSARVIDAEGRRGDRIEEADALISNTREVVVGVRTADCVPVLIADTRLRAVAAVHAGWRGTAGKIVVATIRLMQETFGTRPEDLAAAIGPCIGACCYEVGPEVAHQFVEWCPDMNSVTSRANLNLSRCNLEQLRRSGVTDVFVSGECTFCLPDRYHSFRRDKESAGRMVSFIGAENTSGGPCQIRPGTR